MTRTVPSPSLAADVSPRRLVLLSLLLLLGQVDSFSTPQRLPLAQPTSAISNTKMSIARPSTLQHYGRTTAKVTTTTLYDSSSLAQNTASLENDSTLVTTNTDGEESKIPSYSTLIKFAFTTILIWLSEPLLSLVDCTTVGMFASDSTIQLASLGPATTLTDSLLYLTYFLAISTTNQLAALLSVKDYRKLQSTTSHVLGVAVCLGLAVTATVFVAGTGLLRSMAGSSGTPELVYFAARYTTIRAAVAVAAVTGMVAQSFCLTVQDMKTPIVAMVTASVINVVGDIGLRAYGVQGAAYATAAACVASTTILMRKVRSQMQEWRQLEVLQQNSSLSGTTNMELNLSRTTNSDVTQIEVADLTMFNADNATHVHVSADVMSIASTLNPETHQDVPLLSLPDRESFVGLVRLSGPIFFVMLAKIACYGAMTIAATHFGVVALASHNIMMRVFFFYGCFGDSISQTAQTFLPATMYPVPNKKHSRSILKRLSAMAVVMGVVNSQVAVWILRTLGVYLTKDAAIVQMMRDHTGFFGLAILLHPVIMVAEGAVIASRDFWNLIKTYIITVCFHFGMLKFASGSFPAVWRTFFFFQLIRLVNFGYRVIKGHQKGYLS